MNESQFIAAMFAWPWDLVDEGLDVSLRRIAQTAGCGEVLLTPAYHEASYLLPHNPRRPIYFGEDGAVYFTPQAGRYVKTKIKPRVSQLVDRPGYFPDAVRAIERRGLRFSAWIVYLYNTHLAKTCPDCAREDAFGGRWFNQLAIAAPDVQDYVLALTAEIVENYKPGVVFIESLQRHAWNYGLPNPKIISPIAPRCALLLSLCFHPSAVAYAHNAGIDVERFRRLVVLYLRDRLARAPTKDDEQLVDATWIAESFGGDLQRYLEVSRATATELWKRVAEVIHDGGAKIHAFAPSSTEDAWQTDLDPSINSLIDRVSLLPSSSNELDAAQVDRLRQKIARSGSVLAFCSPGDYPDRRGVQEFVERALDAGADGATFYNYGLLREDQLKSVGDALRATKAR